MVACLSPHCHLLVSLGIGRRWGGRAAGNGFMGVRVFGQAVKSWCTIALLRYFDVIYLTGWYINTSDGWRIACWHETVVEQSCDWSVNCCNMTFINSIQPQYGNFTNEVDIVLLNLMVVFGWNKEFTYLLPVARSCLYVAGHTLPSPSVFCSSQKDNVFVLQSPVYSQSYNISCISLFTLCRFSSMKSLITTNWGIVISLTHFIVST